MEIIIGLFWILIVAAVIVGGSVYWVHKLMLEINVPDPYTWVIPLGVFLVFVVLFFKLTWRHLT